tara:strand:- start:1060 stop:1404 length:345 start_codon:yes stop_codon:yes gene_type:complete
MSDDKKQGFEEIFMHRPESIEQLIDDMNADVYASLKLAIELGKWGDGSRLDAEQIDFCMQAVILYEAKHLPEQDRVGLDLSASCKSKDDPEQLQTITLVTGSNSSDKAANGKGN